MRGDQPYPHNSSPVFHHFDSRWNGFEQVDQLAIVSVVRKPRNRINIYHLNPIGIFQQFYSSAIIKYKAPVRNSRFKSPNKKFPSLNQNCCSRGFESKENFEDLKLEWWESMLNKYWIICPTLESMLVPCCRTVREHLAWLGQLFLQAA